MPPGYSTKPLIDGLKCFLSTLLGSKTAPFIILIFSSTTGMGYIMPGLT